MSRKAAEKWWLDYIVQMPNGKVNAEIYKEVFERMDDAEFKELARRIKEEKFNLPIYIYNMDKERIDVDKVFAVGKSIGVEYFHNLILTDPITGHVYETPQKYLCLHLPVCRQSQHLTKKLSTGKGKATDHLAGQATGDAKSASISMPELTQLDGREMVSTPLELIKPRGGDAVGHKMMRDSIKETGRFSMGPIMEAGSKPKAVETLYSLLKGGHLDSEGLK